MKRIRLTKEEKLLRKKAIKDGVPSQERLLSELIDLKLKNDFDFWITHFPGHINKIVYGNHTYPQYNRTFFAWFGQYMKDEEWEDRYKAYWFASVKPLYNWDAKYERPKRWDNVLMPLDFEEAMHIVKTRYTARSKPQHWTYWQ